MNIDVSTALANLQLDPDNAQALKALSGLKPGNGAGVDPEALAKALADARRWHRERGDFELCLQLIDLELAWTKEAPRRADLLHEKGRLLSDELLRGEAGLAAVQEALKAHPEHGPSKESVAQMSLLRGNWKPISKRYLQQAQEAEAAGKDKAHAASLYVSVAELLLKYGGGEAAGEGEAHLRKSMELDPASRRSGGHVERLLRDKSRWDELLTLYSQRAEAAGNREDRALAEVLAGEVAAKVGKNDEALAHFKRALEASPHESRALRPVREALTRAAQKDPQQWAELAKVLEAAARTKRGEQDVPLQTELATLLWKKLDDTEQAEQFFRRIRKVDPANHDMVEFYRAYYGAKNDQARLLQVIAQAQKAETDVERRVAMGMEMARAAEARPQSAEKAIELWKGLLRLKPRLPEAIASLKTLYTSTEKWNALLEILKEELDALPAERVDDKVARLLEIVAIYRDRLNLDVMVVNTYLSVLALRPDHPDALAALSARYEAQGRWSDLIGVLGKQAEAEKDAAARVALHRRIATLWADKLGKHANAVASLEKILEADPRDAETSAKLKDLYAKSRAWKPLLEVYRRELPHHQDAATRRPRLVEMARVAGERLNDVREAINLWNQVLALEPRDADALAGLATLYERERRWPALVEILERQRRNVEGNAPAELALLERRGMLLYEKLGATEGAIDVFRRIQRLAPQNARAQRALREIYAQSGDFASLETMYVEQGAFGDLCDQLTSLADRTADMGARTRLLERVAALSIEKLNQPERALKAYERILTTDPQNRRAALALVPLYRQAQKWPRLLATYEALLGPAAADGGPPLAERLELLAEARLICEQRLGSKGLAYQWAARAFEAAPKNDAVRADLERVAGEADEWGPLAALFAKRADATTDAEERLWLLRRALRVNQARLYKPTEARVFAERILAEVGQDDEAEAALEQIFTQTKAWPELAKLLRVRADRAPDISQRVVQLFKIAQLEEERVGDAAAAARTLAAIVEAEPTNDRALKALARLAEARGDWAGLVDALQRDLEVRGGDAAAREELLLRIGQIQETRLHDAEATFASYREVLQANPLSAPAVAGLERVAGSRSTPAQRAEIATLCLPYYERVDDAAKLAAAHEALLAVADTTGEKVERLERLRGLYAGPLADPASAYRAGLALFELDPSDAANRGQLVGFAEAAGKTADLVAKARELATDTTDAILRRDLLVTVAELQEQRLGNTGDAEQAYVEILSVEPLNVGAFTALTRIFRGAQRWADLRSLLDLRQGATLEPRERLDLLAQIAEIDEQGLDDAPHAVATYEKMLELDPADMRAHRALDRHYAAAERWRDLEELLGTRVSFATPAEVAELEFRRADLRATRFGDVEGALDLLGEIVRAAPAHEGARRLLEKLLTSADHRQRVARVLEPLYEASGAWARLVAVLEVRREALGPTGAEPAALLARIADLQENKLQARANALATWREVLAADPGNPDALPEIERIATALERFSELVEVYTDLAFKLEASDISGRADLLARAAKLHAGRLNNKRAAVEAWKLVLGLDADNPETGRPAAAALEALYAETGDVAALVKILRTQAGWADGADERKALLFRIAGLEEKSLGDPQAAVATFRAILELDPQDQAAIAGLEQIFEAGSQHAQRVEMLRKRIDLARDPAARQELWRRVAGLLEKDVGDVDEAIAACVAILDESPEDSAALETLSRLYAQQGRHQDNLEILERRLALAKGAGRAELLRQIAALYEGPLGDPANALDRWREVLVAAPADGQALAALERFLQPAVDATLRLQAAQALEPLYEKAGRFAELAGVVQVYVDGADDGRTRLEQRMRLAALQESKLRDAEGAFGTTALAIRDALAEAELPALLDAYERLAGAARVAEVAALYRDISPDVLDEAVKLRLDRFIAEAARAAGDAAGAADFYRRVLDRLPEDEAALAALDRLYREANDAERLVEILVRRADIARDVRVDAAAEQRFRGQLGLLAEAPLGRLDEAIAAFERVLELAPADREAREALDRLYTQTERWTDLTRFLEETLRRGRLAERDVVGIRFRLAQIEHDRQGDREAAIAHLRVVLQGDPDHPGAIAMLEGMLDDVAVQGEAAGLLEPVYAGRGSWPELIKIGEIRLLAVEDPAERVAWTKRIALLYEEQLEDYDSALKWYGKVFQEAPTERQSSEPLLRLADKLGRWQDVGALFASYVADELSDEPAVLEVVRRTAEIFDLRLNDKDEARKHYRRLFDALPEDRAVAQLYESALERWEDWNDLRELVDEQAGRTIDAIAKLTFLRRSAKIDEERLGNRSRAIGTLQEALEIDPTDLAAMAALDAELERLLSAEELWHDLGDHLALVLTRVTEPADREAVGLRLADVLETKIGDVSAAIDRYAEILERNPARREAIAALERIAGDPDHRHRVAVVLEPVYRGAGDRGKLVGALEAQLETIDDREQRVAILREMADNYQRLGRLDLAFDARARAWLVDVSAADTLGEMEALAVQAKQYAPLVATLQKGAVEANDPELQGQLWAISAKLAEEHLGDVVQAIEGWRSALSARPEDVDAFLALERLLAQVQRPAELVEVLERHAEITLDAAEKKAITKRVALLYEDALQQRDSALRAWEAVLDIDANDVEALDALAQLHLAGGSFRELAEILERKLQLVEIPTHRRQLRLDLARLYDEKLDEADQAVSHLRAVLDEAAGDKEALAALDGIFSRDERHADLLEVLDLRAAGEVGPAREALALRAAKLTEAELSDVEGGIARYQQLLAEAPQSAGAREALATIARGADHRLAAVAALEPVLRAARDWAGVVELLELRLAAEDGAAERIATLAEIARIEEVERRDTARAFDAWARALTEEATAGEPRQALERLATATGDWAGLARVYAERIDATFDAGLQRELALRLAELHEGQLGDLEKAAEYLRQALSLPGDEAQALASLERVLRGLGGAAGAELGEILAREAEVAVEPGAQADFLAALGELRLRSLEDAEGALAAFRDALERNPAHAAARGALIELLERAETREGALEVLEPLAEARGDWEELLALYEYRVGLRDEAGERAHWLRKIAELCDARLGDAGRALDALGRALQEEPMPGAALDDLERIAGAGQLAQAGAAKIEAVLDAAEPDAAKELALRAARLYESPPADLGGAERLYQRVLAADPENVDALGALEALYRGAGAPALQHLASILERRAAVELDPQARKRRLAEAARLHEGRGDVAAAIAAWQTLRAAEEGDAEALAELARLHEAAGQIGELVGALAERARFAEAPAERAALWARVGALRLQQGDVDGAADAYREALEGAPEDLAVLGALERIEEGRQDWTALQELLMRRLGALTGPAQIGVLLKLAQNAETRLDDLDQAAGYLRQILDADASNGAAYLELERLLRKGERWYDLVDILAKHADTEAAAKRKPSELALRVAIADVWERELSSPESAVEALEKVLEVAPTNVAALLSMARIHEGAERWDEAAAALERAAANTSSGPEAAEINFRNAQILKAKEAPVEEIEALLLRALDASPAHVPTLEALEALARDAKDDERLVQLLELRLEAQADAKPEVQRKLLSEIAGLYKRLGRGGQAVPVLERLVAIAPDEIGGREDLADALIAAGRTPEAVAIAHELIEQLGKARRGKEAARWHQRLGAIAIAEGKLDAASEAFGAAYKLDPAHPLTLSALGRLAYEKNDHETARKFYRSLLLQSFDEAATGVSKAEVYLMLGRMHAAAKEVPKARNMFERGLEADPKNELLKQALAQLPRG
ncbi:MAG TPA: tetratricopeptide repeat protein [Polyangia bacterium]|nr:tetratricopeptide repeat protein [Polyangia bacterium]